MHPTKLPDDALIERAKSGDPDAWRVLIDRYYRTVTGLAYAVSGDHHAARDIAQDTFVKVLRALPQLSDVSKFPGWLSTIARRTALDWRRRQRPMLSLSDLAEAGTEPEARPDPPPDVYEAVHRAIRQLPPAYREVLLVRHQEALPYKEIAERLGLSISTVETRLFRARQMLAKHLRPLYAPERAADTPDASAASDSDADADVDAKPPRKKRSRRQGRVAGAVSAESQRADAAKAKQARAGSDVTTPPGPSAPSEAANSTFGVSEGHPANSSSTTTLELTI